MIARAGIAWSSLGLMCVSEGMCHGPHGRGVGKLLGLDRGLLSGAGMVLSKGRGRAALQGRELLLLLLEQQRCCCITCCCWCICCSIQTRKL